MEIQIYQTFHKNFPRNENCQWIKSIGVNGFKHIDGFSDADGISISLLNSAYCELTAQYWVWKNVTTDYVGFFHYRRYMSFIFDQSMNANMMANIEEAPQIINYLTSDDQLLKLKKLLTICDVVLPIKNIMLPSVAAQYKSAVRIEPWLAFIACLKSKYNGFVDPASYFETTVHASICNMYVMKKTLFDAYCKDLFQIIDAVYEQIGSGFDSYNNRYPGFLAERFLNYWLHIYRVPSLEVPMIFLDGN